MIPIELGPERHVAGQIAQPIEQRQLGVIHVAADREQSVSLVVAVQGLRYHSCLTIPIGSSIVQMQPGVQP